MTKTKTPHRGYHDMGGLDGGPIDQSEHILAPWEKRVDSIRTLLGDQKNTKPIPIMKNGSLPSAK